MLDEGESSNEPPSIKSQKTGKQADPIVREVCREGL